MVTRGHSDVNCLRDEAEALQKDCQELRIDVEERIRKERALDSQYDNSQMEYGSFRNKLESYNIRNNDLQSQLNRERSQADELHICARAQTQQILDVEAAIASLVS